MNSDELVLPAKSKRYSKTNGYERRQLRELIHKRSQIENYVKQKKHDLGHDVEINAITFDDKNISDGSLTDQTINHMVSPNG